MARPWSGWSTPLPWCYYLIISSDYVVNKSTKILNFIIATVIIVRARLRPNYISPLYVRPLSMLAVLGILILSTTFLAWKKSSRELPASSFVTIPANQASFACCFAWVGHYFLSVVNANESTSSLRHPRIPNDIGLSKYVSLSPSWPLGSISS